MHKNFEWVSKDLRRERKKKKKSVRRAKHDVNQQRYTSVLLSRAATCDHNVLLRMDVKLRNINKHKGSMWDHRFMLEPARQTQRG